MHGELVITQLAESDTPTEGKPFIKFTQPLRISWWAKETLPQKVLVDIDVEPGITWAREFSKENQHPAGRLIDSTESGIEKSILHMLAFEFAHAFNHYSGDPNYGLLHWALYGNFKENATLIEEEVEEEALVEKLKRKMDEAKEAAHTKTGSLATVSDRDSAEWAEYYRRRTDYENAVKLLENMDAQKKAAD